MDSSPRSLRTLRSVRWLAAGLCLILAAPALAQDPHVHEDLDEALENAFVES